MANQTLDSDELLGVVRDRAAQGPAEFWLVVPATPVKDLATKAVAIPMPVMGGTLSLPHPPAEARKRAQAKLDAALTKLAAAGVTADGAVADPDPVRAVAEAVEARTFDEIVIVTLPTRTSRWIHQDVPDRLVQHFQVPVTTVAADDV
ncbi:universal stress protein [Cellulomonas fengjieae]|uniref:Universal stress protein n=1 Tax=Cellulomonas fengjieae TaxID=2819978 RepID=A0ABS3SG66_9CELL|nr:universal stress protein [Cellulomonas fengjieae]MBO3084728.1 universal stress protein [Cellulomonas fengjieae]QVI66950.1 universal stress protein [Cellulomonas fengjieae]